MEEYNRIMSIYEVQQAYQAATARRKNNHRNIRLQDMALRLTGYTGKMYKPIKTLTRKEQRFIDLFARLIKSSGAA